MRKIFEHVDSSRVGHFQSILEQAGIATHIKGELVGSKDPYENISPELWVVNDGEYERALEALKPFYLGEVHDATDWTCPQCKETVEGSFGQCWQCQTMRPQTTA